MFNGKTTIVVGAGAGEEYRMPLGRDLTKTISNVLTIKPNEYRDMIYAYPAIKEALNHCANNEEAGSIEDYISACDEIINGMVEAPSIDEFIHTRQGDKRIELCGKIAIVYSILHAERGTDLCYKGKNVNETFDLQLVQKTWLPRFRIFVTGDRQKTEIVQRFKRITFIVFNYDRCIEHYLLHSLMKYHKLEEKEAAEILDSLEIIHPYGVVGELPWQGNGPNSVKFGDTNLIERLFILAKGIQTFTEAKDSIQQDKIRRAMQEARLILFLGFAFHNQNLDLLTPDKSKTSVRVIGTAKDIAEPSSVVIRRNLEKRFCGSRRQTAELLSNDKTCSDLFADYRHRLST